MIAHTRSSRLRAAAVAGVLAAALAACDLGVINPGPIEDDALNTPTALQPLVVGMGADLSAILDNVAYFMGIASEDINHTGAFEAEFFMQEGKIRPEHVNGLWAGMHRARWVAEQGIERMRDVLGADFEASVLATEAYVWAGYSNRVLGENVCVAIFDGGAPEPHTAHFTRAEAHFTTALELAATQTGTAAATLTQAAHAGRAQVRIALGKYDEAAADAALVSDAFVWLARYSENSEREWNWLVNESQIRAYFSVVNTVATATNDPRTPFTDMKRAGVDGRTPFFRQEKYQKYGDDIDLARGDEMRLIEAESLLRRGDVEGAVARINAVRTAVRVPPVTATAAAMAALRVERQIILWMEARRLWDLRRFEDPFLANRDRCIPPSENEANTNPNLKS
jgi:starch-binding outer membrane protein, SusD/RagB family